MFRASETVPMRDGVPDDVMGSAFGYATQTSMFTPSVDVIARDDEIVFQMDVPGVKQEDLEVTLEKRVLTVRGSRRYDAAPRDQQMVLGRSYGDFTLRYTLPASVDGEGLAAYLADGVLTLRVPKQPKAQPRRIHIGSARTGTRS